MLRDEEYNSGDDEEEGQNNDKHESEEEIKIKITPQMKKIPDFSWSFDLNWTLKMHEFSEEDIDIVESQISLVLSKFSRLFHRFDDISNYREG